MLYGSICFEKDNSRRSSNFFNRFLLVCKLASKCSDRFVARSTILSGVAPSQGHSENVVGLPTKIDEKCLSQINVCFRLSASVSNKYLRQTQMFDRQAVSDNKQTNVASRNFVVM